LDFEPEELAEWAQDLEKRVMEKERRSSEDAQRKRDAARARRQSRAAPSSYMSGGTAAAVAFDALNVTEEVLEGLDAGEGKVANGTAPEGEWLASAMTDPDGYDEAPPAPTG
jgi:hypothetical protein